MFGGMIGAALWLFNPPKLPEENMKKHLMKKVIIDGVEYVPVTPEVKEERLSGWIVRGNLSNYGGTHITATKTLNDTARMIELKENEIIVSREMLASAWDKECKSDSPKTHISWHGESFMFDNFCVALGFKKDGV